jgi:hypothetical protein
MRTGGGEVVLHRLTMFGAQGDIFEVSMTSGNVDDAELINAGARRQ